MKLIGALLVLPMLAALLFAQSKPERPTALRINGQRVNDHLGALSEFGKNPQGGVGRVAYSDADRQGREYVMKLMREAGLTVSIDAAANLVGRRAGSVPGLKPLIIGSHIDSVPDGGNYDGDVGSLGAIEVAQTVAEQHVTLRHPLEVIVFHNEEGGTVGSRAITAGLTENDLNLVNRSGKTVREGIRFIRGEPDKLAGAQRKPGDIAAYVELHIEQGGTLDAEQIQIGVVEGIVSVHWWEVTIDGFANHAGTTPMNQRRDTLLAAAKYVEAVNRVVTSVPGRQVATVGRMQPIPGAYNVIAGKVVTSLDLRDLDTGKIQMLFQKIQTEVQQIEKATGTTFTFTQTNASPPAPTAMTIRRVIDAAARRLGLTTKALQSGAGHDAQEMARLGPIGMIFIPSVDGISHSPREFSRPEDVTNGTNVLLHTLLELDAASFN